MANGVWRRASGAVKQRTAEPKNFEYRMSQGGVATPAIFQQPETSIQIIEYRAFGIGCRAILLVTNNMNILHINTERTWRGGEQQTLNLLVGLNKRGIACHLVCQAGSPMEARAARAGVDVFPITMRGEIDLAAGFRIRKLINKFNYDIVHAHTSHAHTLAYLATIGSGVSRLVTRRVDFSIFRHSFLRLSGIKYRYMADYYIAISHKIKEVLVNDGIPDQRIFVVHSGIDPQRFGQASGAHLLTEFDIKENQKVVINVAHLAGHKGQIYLVRAIPRVSGKIARHQIFYCRSRRING